MDSDQAQTMDRVILCCQRMLNFKNLLKYPFNAKHACWGLITLMVLLVHRAQIEAQPVVTNMTTSIYALVTDPLSMSFASDGTLFVGRDNSGSGGGYGDAVKIHRVSPGGNPVVQFGNIAVTDPDVVIVDQLGLVSGVASSVLVGGENKISRISPDGTVTNFYGPSSDYGNPSGFSFDLNGRFLFSTYENGRVYASTGGLPVVLFSLTHVNYLDVDSANRIVVNSADESKLRLYSSDGVLSNANFANVVPATPVARAQGGPWGTDIYAIGTGGELLRMDLNGLVTKVGSGFGNISDLRFGPDSALYASEFANDRIYRIHTPTVSGAKTTIYAHVTDPQKLTFAPDGTLFVGRDNSGSGGGNVDAVKINKVSPGGTSVTEYGNSANPDPDAVLYDALGIVSGVPGSVIVGGVWSGSSGYFARVAPDQTVTNFFGPSSSIQNPSHLLFDNSGRLLFTDNDRGKVYTLSNGIPVTILSLDHPMNIALDAFNRIVVNSTTDSLLRLYSTNGTVINPSLAIAQQSSPLVAGPGGSWGRDIYFVSTNGNLQAVDPNGVIRTVGAGFDGLSDFAFGPDGALYASHFANDSVWRIAFNDNQPRPQLTIRRSGESIQVAWSLAYSDWTLMGTPALNNSPVWNSLQSPYQTNSTELYINIPNPTINQFLLLRKP